jgi:hypothetical protein
VGQLVVHLIQVMLQEVQDHLKVVQQEELQELVVQVEVVEVLNMALKALQVRVLLAVMVKFSIDF